MTSTKQFAHMVYFTLKDDSSAAQQELVAACEKYLSDHPGTVYFSAGTLADNHRPVNDRDFHVSLHLVFESREAHDAYQAAPRHQEFIDGNQGNWSRVRVFDSEI